MKHVYFVPGLGASTGIFDFIELPSDQFTSHLIAWEMPEKDESLESYCHRFKRNIKHKNPILVGVSFGGIVAQEIAKQIDVEKLVIISSVKSTSEFPRRIRFAKPMQLQKVLPTFLIEHIEWLYKYNFGIGQKKLDRYSRYLSMRDKRYLSWCFDKIVNWTQHEAMPQVIHIHGANDGVFPPKYIENCILIPDAGHAAIITHAKWINAHLPDLLLEPHK